MKIHSIYNINFEYIYPFVIAWKQILRKYEPQINTKEIKGNLLEVFTTHVELFFLTLGMGKHLHAQQWYEPILANSLVLKGPLGFNS